MNWNSKIRETQIGGISVYMMAAEDISDEELNLLRRCMPARMKKADSFRFEEGRSLSAAAGYLMWTVLGLASETELQAAEHGKPYAKGYPPFSVSHSKGMAVLAVAGKEAGPGSGCGIRRLGVDVEMIRERSLSVAKRAFTQSERLWLEGSRDLPEKLERFYRMWTLKEAVMKADGRGLGIDPLSFETTGLMQGQALELEGNRWIAFSQRVGDYMISVCRDLPEGSPLQIIQHETPQITQR